MIDSGSGRRCNTKAELWERLQQAWYKLDWRLEHFDLKLVEGMPRRLHAVIDIKAYPYPTKR